MQNKRFKANESSFVDRLASFSNDNIIWPRPAMNEMQTLVFQQIDLDFYEDRGAPIFRIYGVNDAGNSILAHVYGYVPYLYAAVPVNFKLSDIAKCIEALNNAARKVVVDIKMEEKQKIYGFENKIDMFFKISVTLPSHIWIVKNILESGFEYPGYEMQSFETFESNIDFQIRFMTDMNIVGCNWIEISAYKKRNDLVSKCQLEIDCHYKNIISHPAEGEHIRLAPLRILSFDIECAGRKGVFPEPDKDPVIQIANMVIIQGDKDPFVRNIFTLNTCAEIVGAQVFSFTREVDMIRAWCAFVQQVDPDLITGYNIQNFDLSYLINRANKLETSMFLGRLKNQKTTEKLVTLQSNQMGRRENKQINVEGRVIFDLYLVLLRDYKLRSYTLNAVSFHFLDEQKEDVHHSLIPDLQNGDDNTRRRLAVYCLKDAYLPLRLIDKLMCVINHIEMARVTGVPLGYLLTRGQQIKVISQLLRKAKEQNLLIPAIKVDTSSEFEGATVIEPVKGYYDVPISTLDFSSLYPSIMIAHNLCYTTLLKNTADTDVDHTQTPSGNFFVKAHVRKGILPEILENLLKARKQAKEMMKQEKDPFRYKVLDGRQLALKISANSVYGFTGAQSCKLPCLEISQSVTAFGRQMIMLTKELVESRYTIQNGYKHNAQVIYGDTDSVMVKFGVQTLDEAMRLGKEAAEFVSTHFVQPIKLEFEKCYLPYLLIQKKRYAGLYFTRADMYDKMDCKGIETVRRDNSPLVANLISKCLEKLLIDRDPQGAIAYAKQTISDLLCNRIDISQLIITKELTKNDDEYKGKQAHVQLAAKMRKRDAGSAPQLGDRVPYVIVAGHKGQATYERAEDPVYVLDNRLPIDTQYYLDNQIAKPLVRIFEPILHDRAEFVLLKGEHTLTKKVLVSKIGPLARFTQKKETCLSCKTVLGEKGAVCSHCKSKEREIFDKEMTKLKELEEKFSSLWTQCLRCQGSMEESVICRNKDCSIFYMRKKAQIDFNEQKQQTSRFDF